MQSGSPGDLEAAGDDQSTETMDSAIVTPPPPHPHGPDPAPESVLTDTTMDSGTMQMLPHPQRTASSIWPPEWC